MQLQTFEKTQKFGVNKYLCIEKKTKKEYIQTFQASSDYDDLISSFDHKIFHIFGEKLCCFGEQKLYQQFYNLFQLSIMLLKGIQVTVTLQNLFPDEYKNIKIDLLSLNVTPLNFASPEVLRKESTLEFGVQGLQDIFLLTIVCRLMVTITKFLHITLFIKILIPQIRANFLYYLKQQYGFYLKKIQKDTHTIELRDRPSSLLMNQQLSRTISKEEQSLCSFKESKIEIINESISERIIQSQFLKIKPIAPKRITLDTIENTHSVHRQIQNRPQSSIQRIIRDDQKDLMILLQRIRPNSAVGFSGKGYISRNIKQEFSNRRIIKSSVEPEITTNSFRNYFMKRQQFKVVSVDLKEEKQIKNEHVI